MLYKNGLYSQESSDPAQDPFAHLDSFIKGEKKYGYGHTFAWCFSQLKITRFPRDLRVSGTVDRGPLKARESNVVTKMCI